MHNLFANPYEFLKKFCDTILLAPYNNTCLSAFHVVLQIGQKFSQPPAEDLFYSRTRSMLTSLGLQNYEKNFKRGLLTDSTLPLLTDRQVIGLPFTLCMFSLFFLHMLISWWLFISIDHHSALKDARIPPGPRLLILDHIQRSDWHSVYWILVSRFVIISHFWLNPRLQGPRAEKCKAAVAGCRGVELVELPTNKLAFDEWGNGIIEINYHFCLNCPHNLVVIWRTCLRTA